MRKQKGFNLIEVIIVLVMVGIVGIILMTASTAMYTMPAVTGWSNTPCKGGVLFNRDINGNEVQIIGADGMPVACQEG